MYNYNPLLLIDFYKATHSSQYPQSLTKLVSYYTPRMSRLSDTDKVTMFGLQAFIQEYLIDGFNELFFKRPEDEVMEEYTRVLDYSLGKESYDAEKIRNLHRLGYLPIQIRAIPEGVRSNIHVPQIEISNTHPNFVWLVNTIESVMSCYMWHTQVSAEVGYRYRQIVDPYVKLTCDDNIRPETLLGDFSFRGQHSPESAIKSSGAWCLSFVNTATVPAIMWLEHNYDCDVTKEEVARGAISTEHSVMCSNFAVDGDEITQVRRLLTEIYPHNSFSMVSDSYDYWNLVDNILPQLKEEILNHDGCIAIRGDSGDPVQVVTQTVFHLWNIFGGTVNSKGYKVLNPHVKAIYGDSITPNRCREIYKILTEAGFAVNNVSLGVGSFSMMAIESFKHIEQKEDGIFVDLNNDSYINDDGIPVYGGYTRDTFGIAIKSTYAEDENGNPIFIFKQPKEASFKKSHKGCVSVSPDYTSFIDELTFAESCEDVNNALKTVFCNGEFVKKYTLNEVRHSMYPNKEV